MKKLGIAAIVLAIIAFACTISGAIIGGISFMNSDAATKIGDTLGGIFDFDNGLVNFGSDLDEDDMDYYNQSDSVELDSGIKCIKLKNLVGDVTLKRSKTNELTLECDGLFFSAPVIIMPDNGDVSVGDTQENASASDTTSASDAADGNTVVVTMGEGFQAKTLVSRGLSFGDITVTIPADFDGELRIENLCGEINAENVKLSGAEISDIAGEISIFDCEFEKLGISDTLGEISFTGKATSVDLKNITGECSISLANKKGELNISNCLGNCVVTLQGGASSGVSVNLITDDTLGGVSCDLPRSDRADAFRISVSDVIGNVDIVG